MADSSEVVFEVIGGIGRILLNRADALNALTLSMVRRIEPQLADWAANESVHAVMIEGAGDRAFCAGGDIRVLYDGRGRVNEIPAAFYREEYTLNYHIHRFPKPYVAVMDGITMGGGVGLSLHGSHRVVSAHTVFAMPETGIGLFPDVGGGYFLPRLPGELGMFLALTGTRMKAADCLYAGIGTHFVAADRLSALRTSLSTRSDVDYVLREFQSDPGPAPLAEHREAIDRCFAGSTLAEVMRALQTDGSDWAQAQLDTLSGKSPTSLKIAFRQLRNGRDMDFAEVMRMEYRLSQRCMDGHDFFEGVRAIVIDKDQAPKWDPATLDDVGGDVVDAYFASLGDDELVLD